MAWWWDSAWRKSTGDHRPGFEPTIPSEPPSSLSPSARSRFEVCPPAQFDDDFHPTRTGVRSLLPPITTIRQWLQTSWYSTEQNPTRPTIIDTQQIRADHQLRAARRAFIAALADLDNRPAAELAKRAHAAHSLRELWHLRNPLFTVVSIGLCESIARARLAELNKHFPIREQGGARRGWPMHSASPSSMQRSRA